MVAVPDDLLIEQALGRPGVDHGNRDEAEAKRGHGAGQMRVPADDGCLARITVGERGDDLLVASGRNVSESGVGNQRTFRDRNVIVRVLDGILTVCKYLDRWLSHLLPATGARTVVAQRAMP